MQSVILFVWTVICVFKAYTGWCILSRTTAIPHMVHQRDTPVYYLRVILMIWNILTRILSNWDSSEQWSASIEVRACSCSGV